MVAVTLFSAPLGMRTRAFGSAPPSMRVARALAYNSRRQAAHQNVSVRASQEPRPLLVQLASTAAAISIALLPFAVGVTAATPSFAALDTATERKGVSATIEGSDIMSEDQKSVLDKLKNKILPEAKQMIGKVGSNEGGAYPSTAAKELETVQTEVEGLIRQANEGGDMSNIKSSASGIEQQINALKAIVGFD